VDGDIQQRPAGFQAVLLLLPGTKHGRKKSLPFLVVVVFERSGCCCYYNQSKHEKKFPFRPWMELEKKERNSIFINPNTDRNSIEEGG
jgi:hypothetical protein